MKVSYLFIVLLYGIASLTPCISLCGKDMIQHNSISLKRILNIEGINRHIYQGQTVNLVQRHISELDGIERLNITNKATLILSDNQISDITPLNTLPKHNTIKKIILRDNQIPRLDKDTLLMLQENFPRLCFINLRGNPLKNGHKFERWKEELGLSYSIKVKEKHD